MHRANIAGPSGVLRWGYSDVASVGAWTLVTDQTGGDLSAAIRSTDDFGLDQTPLVFVVPRPTGLPWIWPVVSITVAGDALTARVGLME